jgi:ABC-2 type transport system permease protein
MRGFGTLSLTLAKLHLRDPLSTVLSLALAPGLVAMFGLAFGNDPDPAFGGRGMLDHNLPAIAAWVFAMTGLFLVPQATLTRREAGTLRRFMATPLRPATYVAADVLVNLASALTGVAALFATGMLAFGARGDGGVLAVAGSATLGALAFLALGYALAAILPTARAALVVGNLLAIPMLFLSGATAPLDLMPEAVRQAARLNPVHHAVALLSGAWRGEPWSSLAAETAVVGGLLVVAGAFAAWRFRWD